MAEAEVPPSRLPYMCLLCEEALDKPRGLPCKDVFCSKCLLWHIRTTTADDTFNCPNCRQSFPAPAKRNTVSEEFKIMFPLIEIEEMDSPPQQKRFCDKLGHKQAELDQYCLQHCKLVCSSCVKSTHSKCTSVVKIEEHVADLKKELKNMTERISSHFDKIKSWKDSVFETQQTCMTDLQNIRNVINKTTEKLHKQLDEDRESLLDELMRFEEEIINTEVISTLQFKFLENSLEDITIQSRENLPANNHMKALEKAESLLEQGEEIIMTAAPTVSWSHCIQTRISENMVGTLDINITSHEIKQGTEDQSSNTDEYVKVSGIDSGDLNGIVAMSECTLVISRPSKKLSVIKDNQVVTTCNLPQCSDPSGWGCLVLCSHTSTEDNLCFADYGKKILQLIQLSKDYKIVKTADIKVDYKIRSISFDGVSKQIVVAEYNSNKIRLYSSTSGNLLETCTFGVDSAAALCAVKHPDGRVITVKEKTVSWMDPQGNYITFSRPAEDQLPNPVYMVVDKGGNILVLYHMHGVQLLTPDGKLVRQVIQREHLIEAECMSLCGGLLYVGHHSGKNPEVKVFKYTEDICRRYPEANTINKDIRLILTLAKC